MVQLSDIDAFITQRDYMGITYEEDRIIKGIGENYYQSTWFEPTKELILRIKPRLDFMKERIEIEIDGEEVYLQVFPENTKELVIEFTEQVHQIINE